MNICLMIASFWPAWGGAEGQCRLLARELSGRGHRVVVLTRGQGRAPATEGQDGFTIRRLPAPGSGRWRSLVWTLTAATWIRVQRGLDLFQCYQLLSPAHAAILGRAGRRRQPVVARPACSGPDGDAAEVRRLPFTGLRRQMLSSVDAFVTLSAAIESELAELGLGHVPCHRIPNAVDQQRFRPAAAEERRKLRAQLGLPTDGVLCTFSGRFELQKNPELLLEAWASRRPAGAHLLLVGDGSLRPRLERRIAAAADGSVTLVGPVEDPAALLRASDLFVLPSRAEGLSNALLEAMACGLPVLASDIPGNRELLGGGAAGWLVPAEDTARLAEAIEQLVRDPGARSRLGQAARDLARSYSVERMVDKYLDLYAKLRAARPEALAVGVERRRES
ncbi:MAG TPA: glycosyltransferase family 4 protein [Candidatus Sulfotelmatobacter sp.]|nr:glycosyltransferase family 4 protein [Candidatus Sulfotelmatobacter sp.]